MDTVKKKCPRCGRVVTGGRGYGTTILWCECGKALSVPPAPGSPRRNGEQ